MGNLLGQTLYGVTSNGNVKTWKCTATAHPNNPETGPAVLTIITKTKLDGKPIGRNEVITKGKNIGKSNETTPYEQAVSEATSRYKKKIKKGYKTEIPTDPTKADTNALGMPKPMLAHSIHKVKKVEFPAYIQLKFNGHRALTTKQNGKMMMYSRGGDEITTMQHILDYLNDKIEEGEFLDGELYVHGKLLQDIGSYIRKYQEGMSEMITYVVYDTILDVPYAYRYKQLGAILGEDVGVPVKLAMTQIVRSMGEAISFRDKAIEDAYEGAMLRCPDKGYQAGKKSRTLLKLKTFEDAEFKVIDIIEGKDKCVNDTFFKVAILVCTTEDGYFFKVTAHGDADNKQDIWHNREKHIGRFITVKYYEKTSKGIPFHPVALQWREDI